MVEVLDHLHYKDAALKDSKPDNIIISENKWLKLVDFGRVKEDLHSRMSNRTALLDTLPYNAPEQFDSMINDRGNSTYKADCWFLSFIIYELVSLKLPFTE
jgi:serine/threonine protein kinase